jgi:hypothetical protein
VFAAMVIVSVVLAALSTIAAIRKLSHREAVVRSYLRAGVPEDKLNYLAVILLAAAAGLILGLGWAPIGVAAAAGLIVYFAVAIGFHIRAGDTKSVPTPLGFEAMAVAAFVLRLSDP